MDVFRRSSVPSLNSVLDGLEPARQVIHTEDNDWLVGDGINDPNLPGASVATHLRHVLDRDPTVEELASLPLGHVAFRDDPTKPWRVAQHEWPKEE